MQPTPPCPAPACWWQTRVSGLLFCWELPLGTSSVGFIYLFFPAGYVALWDSKTPHRPGSERVSWCLETSPKTPFRGWVSVPNCFVSLFVFFFWAYLLSKTMGCLSGWLTSSASVQKLFCRIYLDEFVGEKVVSPSYSSVNLGPL